MRVLLSAENFYPRVGGAEVIIDELMTELQARGDDVSVVYVGDRKPDSTLQLFPQSRASVFKNLPLFNRSVVRLYYANFIWRRLLTKKIKELKPDLIFTQLEHTPATVEVARKFNIPCIVYIHNYDQLCPMLFKETTPEDCDRRCFKCSSLPYKVQHPVSMKYIRWQEWALRKASLVISNSQYMSGLINRFYGIKSEVFYPVLHLKDFIVDKCDPEYITFINPIKTKGAEIVLKIVEKMPHHKFLVVGGKDKYFSAEFKKMPNVKYFPWVDDMREVYSKTRILIVPSIWTEPFGRVIPEAQINGIPCITSSKG
ncbi:glycosyltransferase, partial [Candidatus Woesearchaeota archaeon]|nr:glycosyltransferase [Candidatus Woesearchaeota archaeon]